MALTEINIIKTKPVKAIYTSLIMLLPLFSFGQEIWNGNFIEFTKDSLADWTLEENQDRITDNVWITRKNTQGIFNIAQETGFSHLNGSPVDTEWSYGTTSQIDQLTFEPWSWAIDSMVTEMIGQDMVVHLITDDIYIDIRVLEWGVTHAGFGYFKYRRATENVLSVNQIQKSGFLVYPNPTQNSVQVKGLINASPFRLISASGSLENSGILKPLQVLDIHDLNPGLYYLVLNEESLLKFIKK